MNVFGNKTKFAIECKVNGVSPYIMGHIRLWLQNSYIGFFDEEVMLVTSLGSLIELIGDDRKERLEKVLIPGKNNNEELFEFLKNDNSYIRSYTMFSVDESTDDFIIYVYREKNTMKFLWQLYRSPLGKYGDYPKTIHSTSVEFSELENVISEFDKFLSSLKLLKD